MKSVIKNGVPWTDGDEALLTDLSKEEQQVILDWIKENVTPRKGVLHGHTSYGIKHIQEHDTKIYLTNNQFKHAMLLAGYEPYDEHMLNWIYCISKRSKCFDYKARGYIA